MYVYTEGANTFQLLQTDDVSSKPTQSNKTAVILDWKILHLGFCKARISALCRCPNLHVPTTVIVRAKATLIWVEAPNLLSKMLGDRTLSKSLQWFLWGNTMPSPKWIFCCCFYAKLLVSCRNVSAFSVWEDLVAVKTPSTGRNNWPTIQDLFTYCWQMFSTNLLQDETLNDPWVKSAIVNLLPPIMLSKINISFLIFHSQIFVDTLAM